MANNSSSSIGIVNGQNGFAFSQAFNQGIQFILPRLASYPFDSVMTIQQVSWYYSRRNFNVNEIKDSKFNATDETEIERTLHKNPNSYHSISKEWNSCELLKRTINVFGFSSLYRGFEFQILRSFTVAFLNKNLPHLVASILKLFGTNSPISRYLYNFLDFIGLGTISLILIYPLDSISILLSSDPTSSIYTSTTDVIQKMSIPQFYSGFLSSFVGTILYRSLNHSLQPLFNSLSLSILPPSLSPIFTSIMTVLASGLITYPFSTIRKTQIVSSLSLSRSLSLLYEEEGLCGFYHGVSSYLLRSLFSFSLIFTDAIFFSSPSLTFSFSS